MNVLIAALLGALIVLALIIHIRIIKSTYIYTKEHKERTRIRRERMLRNNVDF